MPRGFRALACAALAASLLVRPPQGAGQGPAPTPLVAETLRNFNPEAVRLSWSNRRWVLVCDNQVLKDFAAAEQEARLALRLIQQFGLNQLGTVGAPQPVMEYWLVNGQAPHGALPHGLRSFDIDPGALRVQRVGSQFCLYTGQKALFNFGARDDEAEKARVVLRKYRFTQLGVVGQVVPLMYVFLGPGPAGPQGVKAAAHSVAPAPFPRLAKNADGSPHIEKGPPNGLEAMAPALARPLAAPPGPGADAAWRQKPLWRQQMLFGKPPPVVPSTAERVPFDWRQVQMRQYGGEWTLSAGGLLLGNFRANMQGATNALAAVRYYRFTEQMNVGDPPSQVCCYLTNSQSPRGLMFGLPAESFEPQKVAVEKGADGYHLAAGTHVLLRLGGRKDQADRLLESIRRNRYDRLCRLGEPGQEAMTILVRSR
jgi:hypothetical protein